MNELHKILYLTIKNFELEQQSIPNNWSFDAYEVLSKKCGYKSSSSLRKMCEPKVQGSNAPKLGMHDAMIIMLETNDFRLLKYYSDEIKKQKEPRTNQLNLFASPLREIL